MLHKINKLEIKIIDKEYRHAYKVNRMITENSNAKNNEIWQIIVVKFMNKHTFDAEFQ